MCAVQVWYKECFCSGARHVCPIEKSFAQQEKKIRRNSKIKLFPWYLCIENVFDWHLWSFFLFGLVKQIFGLPKSEEYLPEGLPGVLKFCEPWRGINYYCNQLSSILIHFNNLYSSDFTYGLRKSCLLFWFVRSSSPQKHLWGQKLVNAAQRLSLIK